MPTTIVQANRPIEIQTPLGADVLGLRSFVLEEKLGHPFVIYAELSSDDPEIKFDDIVGHPVAIRLTLANGERYFHAVVAKFLMLGQEGDYFHYRATLVPWLWGLTRSADVRMFQEKTAPDIVQQIFRDRGFKDFELGITGTYPARDYCIQYRESDFNFVSRLLEEEGISYFFKHSKEKGQLVLADQKSAYSPAEGYETLIYRNTEKADANDNSVKNWKVEHEVQPTKYTLQDYNYLTPKVDLKGLSQMEQTHGLNEGEIYDYPGEYLTAAEGTRLSRVRLEEIQVHCKVARAETTCLALSAGSLFTLDEHPRTDQNAEHLITALTLRCDAGEFSSDKGEAMKSTCSFVAIPSTQPFRPARVTPRPVIHGPQHAKVVGPSGEEIHTDEHGRVKLHFFWDRDSKADEKSSCWVRVAQGWSGKKWGSIFIPRVGHEVLVEFIEGDPDRPLVTGSVFNADNVPPYALPAEKTKSTLKSLSSPDGGGFNEFRFEDKKGSEEVFLHAQKDMVVEVVENSAQKVDKDKSTIVGGKTTAHLKAEHHLHVVGNELAKFDADRNSDIAGNHHEAIKGADHLGVGGDRMVKIDGADNLTVGKDLAVKTTGKATLDAGADLQQKSGGSFAVEAAQDVHIKAGMKLILEAGTQISLKVGGNFIDIGPAGVAIKGTMVMINSGGAAGSGSGCSPLAPAAPEAPDPPVDPEVPPEVTAGEKTEAKDEAEDRTVPEISAAAFVLVAAAADGAPFCEECAKAAEEEEKEENAAEIAVIESITLIDGENVLTSDGIQVVNLPKAATWVDAEQGITSQDRLGPKLKFKVKFNLPGAHPFKVIMAPGDDNADVSDAEKGRNAKFKHQSEEKSYTTDGDGTKTVADDFFVSCCGLDTFKLVAEDTTNQISVESSSVTVRKSVFFQPITMTGSPAPDFSAFISEFARHGIDVHGFPAKEIAAMPNIGSSADSKTYSDRVKGGFGSSPGNAKKPHCVALGVTGYLAFKNADKPLPEIELYEDETGPDAAEAVEVPVQVANLEGGGMGLKGLWKDLVPGESWLMATSKFEKAAGGSVTITEDMCTLVATRSNDKDFRTIMVDATKLPAGGGTLKLRVNVVDRWRNGISLGGGNIICIASKAAWRDRDSGEMVQTLIHEMGHKVGMVCDGTGTAPDEPENFYTERGHKGPHCHTGLVLADDFRSVTSGAECVMFGSNTRGRPNEFCPLCTPAARKLDISAGFGS